MHRELVFCIGHEALRKARLKPPHTFKEAKLADDIPGKAYGLDVNEGSCYDIHSYASRAELFLGKIDPGSALMGLRLSCFCASSTKQSSF
jgi:hypothetical protein